MPPPAVLRKRHSLRGKDIFPLIKRVRAAEEPDGTLARVKMNTPVESMGREEMNAAFEGLTGESAEECLQMVGGRQEDDLRKLLHYTILYANEVGQPDGQDLETDESARTEPLAKKQKKSEEGLEKRIQDLEKSKKNEEEEEIGNLKAKVRGLCMQTEPSLPLILVCIEELARTARKSNYEEAAVFEELSRQANCNKDKLDIPSFCMTVLGGKATDVVSKALAKALKVKSESGEGGCQEKVSETQHQSPLMNLSPHPHHAYWGFGQGNFAPPMYPYGGVAGYSGYRKYQRGSGRGQSSKGNCLFCGASGHYVRDCLKMKAARGK
ncbi:uncharacterized protein LOC133178716 [Saccostrea echinata]|uniref:uncharacterized protein LOC133178716 n=1 Tax=Saccostrea echinata TaxID=191078 RepID=UPI002A830BD0|nr:uncharacterized protein LOC133178716 [Saccostrea echinata]